MHGRPETEGDDEIADTRLHQPSRIAAASWYALAVLTFINVFGFMDRLALSILMEAIKADLHLSDEQLGLLSGFAFALFYAILGVPLARLADRSSRVKLISVCLALWSAMTALSGMARNYPQLFLARMGVGIGEAGCVPPAHSLIGDYFPREKRALGISIFNAGAAVGAAFGMFAIGAIADQLGWRSCLMIIGVLGLPLALLTIMTLRDPPRPKAASTSNQNALAVIRSLLRRRAFLHLAIAFSVGHISTNGISQWIPTYLIRSHHMSMAEVGAWIGGIAAASGTLGVLTGGLLAPRLLKRDLRWELWIPGCALAICLPAFIIMVLAPAVWVVLSMQVVIVFCSALASAVAITAVQSFAEPDRRATAVSLVLFLASLLGGGLGPYLIGLTSEMLVPVFGDESLRYALLIACFMLVWSVFHYFRSARHAARDWVN